MNLLTVVMILVAAMLGGSGGYALGYLTSMAIWRRHLAKFKDDIEHAAAELRETQAAHWASQTERENR